MFCVLYITFTSLRAVCSWSLWEAVLAAGAGGDRDLPPAECPHCRTASPGHEEGGGWCWLSLTAGECCSAGVISSALTGISPLCNCFLVELVVWKAWSASQPQCFLKSSLSSDTRSRRHHKTFLSALELSVVSLRHRIYYSLSLSLKSRIEMFSSYILNLPMKNKILAQAKYFWNPCNSFWVILTRINFLIYWGVL